ncbi:MAG: hypothetical protein ABW166_09710 [Sedimenticola sp.]
MVSDKRIINAMVLFSLDILWSFANTLIFWFYSSEITESSALKSMFIIQSNVWSLVHYPAIWLNISMFGFPDYMAKNIIFGVGENALSMLVICALYSLVLLCVYLLIINKGRKGDASIFR